MNKPLLLINLEHRKDRLKDSLKTLRDLKISDFITRVEACNKEDAYKLRHKYILIE